MITEDVKNLMKQGVPEEQIVQTMRDRGASYKEISDAIGQSKIKAAVEQSDSDPNQIEAPIPSQGDMQPSIMGPSEDYQAMQAQIQQEAPAPQVYANQQDYQQQYTDVYNQLTTYPTSNTSSDLVTEIAEQIVAEKLGELRKNLEKVADLKTTLESKMDFMDERLRRIEKTIDILQSSVLKKVGDYVTNIQDIKTELVETQKTFARLMPQKHQQNPGQRSQGQGQHHHHKHHK